MRGLEFLSCCASSRTPPSVEVGYVTDVEGNLDYFDKWVACSGVLHYSSPGVLDLTHDRAYFVFGGDAMDRGDGGLRFVRRLVALKQRHPNRVFLLAGNRDLNKVRFTSELSESDLRRPPHEILPPHWDPNAPTLEAYLTGVAEKRGVEGGAAAVDSRVERMQYFLQHTLGCPGTFEGRRRELALLGEAPVPVSDEAVVDSLVSDIQPGGCLRQYLENACLAAVLGNTIFVHGALDANAIGLVPSDSTRFHKPPGPQPMRAVAGVHEWAEEMNSLLQRGLSAHLANPEWDANRETRGGEVLLALQNRCAMWGRCIVSGAYADGGSITSVDAPKQRDEIKQRLVGEGNPLEHEAWVTDPRDQKVADWLLAAGVRRICVGHKPSADSPAILASDSTGVEIISADTSYADPRDKELGRGVSMAGVTIVGPSLEVNYCRVFGVLADGRAHDVRLATLDTKGKAYDRPGDAYVGRELDGGWWCKAKLSAPSAPAGPTFRPPTYLCCRGSGRKVEFRDVEASTEAYGYTMI